MPSEYATAMGQWGIRDGAWHCGAEGGERLQVHGQPTAERSVPIYQPWAKNMRRPKRMKSVAVPPHRYGVYGVDLSRYV
jgi:hypothetical protein